MTRDRRLLLLLGLLIAYGLFVVECRYHQREDATTTEAKHRHRHRHESSNRRGHHELDRKSWQEVDYEYDGDSEDPIDEDDYEARSYYDYPRSPHHRSAQKSYHSRMFEPRYPSRYHNGGYGSGWYDEDNDRRRISPRYNTRNHRYRPGRTYYRPAYSRNRDVSDYDDDTEENYDYEWPQRYGNGETDKHHERWRDSRRHTPPSRRDWRSKMNSYYGARRHRLEDREGVDRVDVTKRTDDWRRRSNSSDAKYHFAKDDRKTEEDEDYEDHGGLEEDDKDEDEDDIWKDIADDRNEDNGKDELDNDFYKSETKPPLKTYDEIIRRLTSDDPTTPKTTVKRDYRNTETNKHVKRDGYKNFKYEPRNVSRPLDLLNAPHAASTTSNYSVNKRTAENSTVKSTGHKPSRNTVGEAVKGHDRQEGKIADTQTKTKSLEQDYDEYLNSPDNEKEDDLVKAGIEDDSTMQADVNNTDYSDDDNGDEDEGDTFTTSSTTTTTTTTTTMRPKPSQSQLDYKDPRAYDSSTGAQYNGYQAKNDYPPMSAHSIHKWQSLGTREGVKETRSNMQQYNKNGKSDERIREALQHALKVNKEGSCRWPRARVISVRDVYPSPSTTYIPHCAILHRCSDDTGCCKSEAFTCVPKHPLGSHRVELSFYTTSVDGASVVEKLSFYNHTECECRMRTEFDTVNDRPSDQRVSRHHQSSLPPQNMKKPPSRKPCRCPSEFMPRVILDGICQCNCNENNENCIKTRRGKGYFSLADRICIQNNACAMPTCEFGEYIKAQGKCPRKRDTFDAMTNHRTNPSHHRVRS
ncbi:PREDICTED: uncharacterized protein LOC105567851 [Vollenhovia emeryi]|uniref:uncharacterized protein LOC105567851 n=1 Tax=Vollenhovia emeryi TaxID=411798 RepID=UPI0005F3954B|nr:PREDICTED: uncharacterized protein LOC105567851 [Vollenhovia emeryi]